MVICEGVTSLQEKCKKHTILNSKYCNYHKYFEINFYDDAHIIDLILSRCPIYHICICCKQWNASYTLSCQSCRRKHETNPLTLFKLKKIETLENLLECLTIFDTSDFETLWKIVHDHGTHDYILQMECSLNFFTKNFNSVMHDYFECLDDGITDIDELKIFDEIKNEFDNKKSSFEQCKNHVLAKFMLDYAEDFAEDHVKLILNSINKYKFIIPSKLMINK